MNVALERRLLRIKEVAPATAHPADADLVLLHGWGSDSRIWQHVVPYLSQHYRIHLLDLPGMGENADHNPWRDESALLRALAEVMPEQAHIAGWSLGGNLALAYARQYPGRVQSLYLIATNLSFVARPDWQFAMPESDFEHFYQLVQADAAAGLRRFAQLQVKGDLAGRALVRQLRELYATDFHYDAAALLDALAWLRAQDQRHLLALLGIPIAHILGERDGLVPQAVAGALPSTTILAGAGHIPMLSDPGRLAKLLLQAPDRGDDTALDKRRIARSFSNAAESYDSAAELQREVGSVLSGLMPAVPQPGIGLDLGCGTGFVLQQLIGRGTPLEWLGGDIAEGMLQHAEHRHSGLRHRLIVMDAESLPLADSALQGVYSNLALQWCQDLEGLFAELRRVTCPGGWMVFSTLVEGTLDELRAAWRGVDGHVHVNHFYPAQTWQDAAADAGWHRVSWHSESRTRHYAQLRDLLTELKALGAHNVNAGMPGGLTGKRSWQQLNAAYERNRDSDGKLPASWQLLYGVMKNG